MSTTFTVTVKGAAAQLADLYRAVSGVGIGNRLADTVALARRYLAAGQPQMACALLNTFILQVQAQVPSAIGPATAATLVADATRIRAVLGCTGSLF